MTPITIPAMTNPDQRLCWHQFPLDVDPSMSCRNGHWATLVDHHIAEDGTVTPSVLCGEDGCGFHEMVILEGFSL